MDPKAFFETQTTLFLSSFPHKDWITRRDTVNSSLSLIPPQWSLHPVYRGVFFEFSINVKGEMIFAIAIENPIALEHRVEFKKRLEGLINKSDSLSKSIIGYEVSLEQRGKFIKKTIPLLSDTVDLMNTAVESLFQIIPIVSDLISFFKNEGKVITDFSATKSSLKTVVSNGSKKNCDFEYDEGDSEEEEYFDYNPTRKIFTQKTDYGVNYLHKLYKRGKLNLQPDFQRQFVWDSAKSSSLIESLLLDVPIPVIYLFEDTDSVLSVIDGQQRLCSIFSFIDGQFPDGRKFSLSQLRILSTLNGKSFRDIEADYQEKIDSSPLSTIIIKKESDPELRFDIFERLNTGSVKLNDQELRNCIYRGNYLSLLKKLSADTEYMYIMGLKEPEKRMKDVEFVLHFGAFYHQTYLKLQSGIKSFLNNEMKMHQNLSKDECDDFVAQFHKAVQINYSLFGARSFRKIACGNPDNPNMVWKSTKNFNNALFDLMMVSFVQYDKNMVFRHLDAIREAYISLLTEDFEFIDAVEKWTNNQRHVKYRYETFDRVLSEIFSHDNKQERCFSKELKELLFKQNDKCSLCNQQIISLEDAAVDHIEQYWLGGKTIPSNARLTHRFCNASRKRKEGSGSYHSGNTNELPRSKADEVSKQNNSSFEAVLRGTNPGEIRLKSVSTEEIRAKKVVGRVITPKMTDCTCGGLNPDCYKCEGTGTIIKTSSKLMDKLTGHQPLPSKAERKRKRKGNIGKTKGKPSKRLTRQAVIFKTS
jgi:hypothetical protein